MDLQNLSRILLHPYLLGPHLGPVPISFARTGWCPQPGVLGHLPSSPSQSVSPQWPEGTCEHLSQVLTLLCSFADDAKPKSSLWPPRPCMTCSSPPCSRLSLHSPLLLTRFQAHRPSYPLNTPGVCLRAFAYTSPSAWAAFPPHLLLAPSSPPSGLATFQGRPCLSLKAQLWAGGVTQWQRASSLAHTRPRQHHPLHFRPPLSPLHLFFSSSMILSSPSLT